METGDFGGAIQPLPNTEKADYLDGIDSSEVSWKLDGACHDIIHPNIFFPTRKDSEEEKLAKKICQQCSVKEDCLDYALGFYRLDGIWGGMNEEERRRERRERAV